MKKNNYKQPLSEAVELNPMQVLCGSNNGVPVNDEPVDNAGGDAPKRRIF